MLEIAYFIFCLTDILLRCLNCLLPLLIELVDTFVLYTVCCTRNPIRSIFCGRVFVSVVSLFCPFLYLHIGRLHTLTGYGGFIYGLYCAFDRISGFYISHFCHYNEPAVPCGVFAGGKGNEPVAVFSGHTCIIQSKLLALPDIGIKIFLILRINKVVVSESLRTVRHSLKHSDDFILCLLCEGIKLNSLVFLIKALGLVILQRSKHLAALNVMTVDNQIVTFSNIAILLHIRRS